MLSAVTGSNLRNMSRLSSCVCVVVGCAPAPAVCACVPAPPRLLSSCVCVVPGSEDGTGSRLMEEMTSSPPLRPDPSADPRHTSSIDADLPEGAVCHRIGPCRSWTRLTSGEYHGEKFVICCLILLCKS